MILRLGFGIGTKIGDWRLDRVSGLGIAIGIGDLGLGINDWGVEIGIGDFDLGLGLRLGIGDWGLA